VEGKKCRFAKRLEKIFSQQRVSRPIEPELKGLERKLGEGLRLARVVLVVSNNQASLLRGADIGSSLEASFKFGSDRQDHPQLSSSTYQRVRTRR
jgi:hypothetical protein